MLDREEQRQTGADLWLVEFSDEFLVAQSRFWRLFKKHFCLSVTFLDLDSLKMFVDLRGVPQKSDLYEYCVFYGLFLALCYYRIVGCYCRGGDINCHNPNTATTQLQPNFSLFNITSTNYHQQHKNTTHPPQSPPTISINSLDFCGEIY